MNQRPASCVPAVFIGLLAAIFALHSTRPAAGECIERHPPAYGGHWYYHPDRATGRRCWHLVGEREPAAMAPQVEMPPPPQPDTVHLLSSFFSSLFAPAGPPPPPPDLRPAVAQSEPRREERVARRRRPAEARPAPEPRPAPEAKSAPEKPEPESKPRPKPPSPDQADRDALFREYLRWREQQ